MDRKRKGGRMNKKVRFQCLGAFAWHVISKGRPDHRLGVKIKQEWRRERRCRHAISTQSSLQGSAKSPLMSQLPTRTHTLHWLSENLFIFLKTRTPKHQIDTSVFVSACMRLYKTQVVSNPKPSLSRLKKKKKGVGWIVGEHSQSAAVSLRSH